MATVKLSKKELLETIRAKLMLQLGRTFTQQEVVDLCLEHGYSHFEQLITEIEGNPRLTLEIAEQLLSDVDTLPDIPYDPTLSGARAADRDIYSV